MFRNIRDFEDMMQLARISKNKYGNNFTYTLLDDRDLLKFANTGILIAGVGFVALSIYLFIKKSKG